ncbi:MAG TPA: endonuclease III [Puia sp.]|nr:endonuclease III [Puia sp.]
MPVRTDWAEAMKPLLKKYKKTKFPLDYENGYQLLVMVILAAQSTDRNINLIGPDLFAAFPDMKSLSAATPEALYPYIGKVRNFANKANWLVGTAKQIKKDSAIPRTLDELTAYPGIGRKSANVILRESGAPAEGVIVDLHVVRVAPRLGIASGEDPKKIEKQIMEALPQQEWDAGMAMSFLGREICRPKPECERCLMNPVCAYYQKNKRAMKATKPEKSTRAVKAVKGTQAVKPAKSK